MGHEPRLRSLSMSVRLGSVREIDMRVAPASSLAEPTCPTAAQSPAATARRRRVVISMTSTIAAAEAAVYIAKASI